RAASQREANGTAVDGTGRSTTRGAFTRFPIDEADPRWCQSALRVAQSRLGAGWVRTGQARSIRDLRGVSNEPNEPCPAARRWRVLLEVVARKSPQVAHCHRRASFQTPH